MLTKAQVSKLRRIHDLYATNHKKEMVNHIKKYGIKRFMIEYHEYLNKGYSFTLQPDKDYADRVFWFFVLSG